MLRKGGQNLLTRMRVVESACASGPSSTLGGGIQNAVSSMDGCVFGYNLSIDMLIWGVHAWVWVYDKGFCGEFPVLLTHGIGAGCR